MIYELKQPKEDDKGEETAVLIGTIAFYYAQNELQCGNSRVVITSRQAEILKLLAENVERNCRCSGKPFKLHCGTVE